MSAVSGRSVVGFVIGGELGGRKVYGARVPWWATRKTSVLCLWLQRLMLEEVVAYVSSFDSGRIVFVLLLVVVGSLETFRFLNDVRGVFEICSCILFDAVSTVLSSSSRWYSDPSLYTCVVSSPFLHNRASRWECCTMKISASKPNDQTARDLCLR